MTHTMNLHSRPFQMIASGQKTIELRLYDEKRQQLAPGDTIVFTRSDCPECALSARVERLHLFPSFEALYAALPLLKCGYTEDDVDSAHPDDMAVYYPAQRQQQYGVVGIELSLL